MRIHLAQNGQAALDKSHAASPRELRLQDAAHQFEASLLQELMKPLQQQGAAFGGDDQDEPDGSQSALAGYGSEALARAMSDRGGFGIANQILAHFASSPHAPGRE